jgi:hypothetical protein
MHLSAELDKQPRHFRWIFTDFNHGNNVLLLLHLCNTYCDLLEPRIDGLIKDILLESENICTI